MKARMVRFGGRYTWIYALAGGVIAATVLLGPVTSWTASSTRVFHASLRLVAADLRISHVVQRAVGRFVMSAFDSSELAAPAPLSQILATINEQARSEGWGTLRLDVWAGGEESSRGYYLRYEGKDSSGSIVQGGAFITTPHAHEEKRGADKSRTHTSSGRDLQ